MIGGSSGLKKKGKSPTKGEDTDSAMEKFIKKFGTGAGNSGGKDGSTGPSSPSLFSPTFCL